MTVLLIFSFVIFAAYITVIIKFFGVPHSISDSFYLLEGRRKGLGYVFTLWCWAVAFTVMAAMLQLSQGQWWQFLSLFAGGGLVLVGTAPMFKGHERTVHYASAGTCAVATLLWMCLEGYCYAPAVWMTVCGMIAARLGKPVFWIEAGMFLSVFTVLFIEIWAKI
jgi:hypothetical protein